MYVGSGCPRSVVLGAGFSLSHLTPIGGSLGATSAGSVVPASK